MGEASQPAGDCRSLTGMAADKDTRLIPEI